MSKDTILIIEDEPALREMMQQVLEDSGCQVLLAADGQEGLEKLRLSPTKPCLVILDLVMPKVSGWEFLDAQRNDPGISEVPVLICSAYPESARAIHPTGLIEKPIQTAALLEAVKKFCR